MHEHISQGRREGSCFPQEWPCGCFGKRERTPKTDEQEQSDRPIVPQSAANKAAEAAGERREGRGLAKGNSGQPPTSKDNSSRVRVASGLARVGYVAERRRGERFTALMHHVDAVEALREAYFSLKRDAAAGVDGETWQHYGEDLEGHLAELSERLRRGAYRAKAVRRAYIPKADGRRRPLGVPVLEDKIVQRAVVAVLNAVYEPTFADFSYGFRPRRGAHQALEALNQGLRRRRVNWVLDADIRGYFEAIDHEWLVKLIQLRIGDRRVVRLIQAG